MSSADRVAHIDGQLMQLLWVIHIALPAEYKCSYDKTEQSIYEQALPLVFNIFCAATNFGCIDSFLLPNFRNEEMMVMVSFGATAAGLFWTVNVCWASCIQGQRSSE